MRLIRCAADCRRALRRGSAAVRGFGLLAAAALSAQAAAQSCTVSATATAFGTYNPTSPLPLDVNGRVDMSCAAHPIALLLGYTITLSPGGSGSYAARRMSSGAQQFGYQLYSDALRSTVWGDGSAGTGIVNGGLTLALFVPSIASHPVYGRIPALQSSVVPGSYADVITVTVSY